MREAEMSIAIQGQFAKSLLNADLLPPAVLRAPEGADAKQRFGVYRNNVVVGLVRAMETRFPVVARLVGAEFFRAMAQAFVTEDPPRSPILFRYGSSFPAFIEGFAPAAKLPYLADVARLELARGSAYHAADARPLPPEAFASLDADKLGTTGVRFHPSVEFLSSRFPVVSIWRAHQSAGDPRLSSFEPEAALVVRPVMDVEVHLLPRGGYPFLTALAQGASFSRAAAIATAEVPGFHAVKNLAVLIEANAVLKLVPARML
jgi:hypothetical protein